jgi:hypothetical protein
MLERNGGMQRAENDQHDQPTCVRLLEVGLDLKGRVPPIAPSTSRPLMVSEMQQPATVRLLLHVPELQRTICSYEVKNYYY